MKRAPRAEPKALTLTTDFGLRDHYVGAMKGVVATLAPEVRIFDITHEVPSFDVAEGAFVIAQAYGYYPPGTVHVVVVDPGVGSSRGAIAAACDGHFFIAPDNGVLSQVFESAGGFDARQIDRRHGLASLSRTFHGRDLFAPAGASLANGLSFEALGARLSAPVLQPLLTLVDGMGRVLHVDGYGNLVTSFRPDDVEEASGLTVGGVTTSLRADSYADAPTHQLFMIAGSSGYVEISLNRGSAATKLGVRAGAQVVLSRLWSGKSGGRAG